MTTQPPSLQAVLLPLSLILSLIAAGCATAPPASSPSQEKQFTNMWEEIYQRLKPEIDSGNISVDRRHTNPNVTTIDGDSNNDSSRGLGKHGESSRGKRQAAASAPSSSGIRSTAEQESLPNEYIRIRFADRVLFDSGDDQIKPDGVEVLTRLGHLLQGERDLDIVIQGHTDNVPIRERLRPRFPDNLTLSRERAANAARILHQSGVSATITRLAWFGEDRPIDSNDTDEGRRKNRRVEIMITPK